MLSKHFVRFYSPGTFVAEMTEKPIDAWDVNQAVAMAGKIVERHNARPYGFCFITRERDDNDLDSHEAARSPMYHLGGKVLTLAETSGNLRLKMENNGWNRAIINENSWSWTSPLDEDDVVLDVKLPELEQS
jgi:hypothetical protein